MIPIRDINPSKTAPIVNNFLIAINVLVFVFQLTQSGDSARFLYFYGLVPARYSVGDIAAYFSPLQQAFSFFSFMFLHGGFFHILGNIWFLYIFGDNVEDELGPGRYAAFYLLCGISSGLMHMLFNMHSNVPVVGASGAIAGVMGAYFILYPGARVLTLFPILFIPLFFEIPAFVFMGIWFIIQFVSAIGSSGQATDIAWWAHIGGFICGILFLKLLGRMPRLGISRFTRQLTERKKTHHLQVLQPTAPMDDIHLYGTLVVTPFEASHGAQKLVNIPWGFHSQLYRITVPPDTQNGSILRLNGAGRRTADGLRGDVLLTVQVKPFA